MLLVGRGSDEAIDLLVRGFCRAERDAVLVCPPTFGMYAVAARIQGAQLRSCRCKPGTASHSMPAGFCEHCGPEVKVVFLCSPNNPTGNLLATGALREVITRARRTRLGGRGRGVHRVCRHRVSLALRSRATPISRCCVLCPRPTGSPARAAAA